jgi:hypothetical protein
MDFWINRTTRLYLNGAHPLGYREVVMKSLLQIITRDIPQPGSLESHTPQKNGKAQGVPEGGRIKDEKADAESPASAWSKIAMKCVRYPSRI